MSNLNRKVCPTDYDIIEDICSLHDVSKETIFSKNRNQKVVDCRQEIWRELYSRGLSQSEIARLFNRHSSTVCYSINKLLRLIKKS